MGETVENSMEGAHSRRRARPRGIGDLAMRQAAAQGAMPASRLVTCMNTHARRAARTHREARRAHDYGCRGEGCAREATA